MKSQKKYFTSRLSIFYCDDWDGCAYREPMAFSKDHRSIWRCCFYYPFHIQKDVTLPIGIYTYRYWQADFSTNKSRNLYTSASYRWGGFYSGRSKIVHISAGLRPISSFTGEISFIYNDIDLPEGNFSNHLLRGRLIYNFSTRLALMSLVQWNGDTDEVNMNIRLNFIHKPGSDLFVVYSERRLIEGLETGIMDRTVAVKFTYLFNL